MIILKIIRISSSINSEVKYLINKATLALIQILLSLNSLSKLKREIQFKIPPLKYSKLMLVISRDILFKIRSFIINQVWVLQEVASLVVEAPVIRQKRIFRLPSRVLTLILLNIQLANLTSISSLNMNLNLQNLRSTKRFVS